MAQKDEYKNTDVKEELYSDFLTDFNYHPATGLLLRFVDEFAIKRSIRNLLMTNKYERLFQPSIGSSINRILFEPVSSHTSTLLKQYIVETIDTYEKRCKLIEVIVEPAPDQNLYKVTVVFAIINKEDPIAINITLYRVR
jgi:phage baseplate assembly protein W